MWHPLLCEILVTNLFQGRRLADDIELHKFCVWSIWQHVWQYQHSPLQCCFVCHCATCHFFMMWLAILQKANNISSFTNFGKAHMFVYISLYNFGFYPPCTVHIVFHFGNILYILLQFTESIETIFWVFKPLADSKKTSAFCRCSGWPDPKPVVLYHSLTSEHCRPLKNSRWQFVW